MSIAATLSLNLPAITALCIGTRGSQIWSGTGSATTGASSYPVLSGDYYVDKSTGNYYGPYTTTWATSALFTLSFPQTAIPFTTYSSNSSLIVPVYSVNNSILSGSNFSIIFGGQNNTLSGSNLIIFGGLNNTLTGNNSFILGSNIVAKSAVNITFVNNLSSTNNIFASNNITALNSVFASTGNSNQWSNVYTSVYNTSASWNNVFTSVNNTSASWNNVFTSVNNTSANWNSSYSTLTANSGTWVTYTALTNVSGNWQNTYTSVNNTSANWNNSYTTLTANSANWNNSYTTLTANSGNWNSNYTNTFNNSASWYNTYTTVQTYSAGWTSITSASAATYTQNANNSLIPIKGNNTASGTYSNVGGGKNNVNSANCSVIVGGAFNATQTGNAYSSIVGGLGLSAYGNFSHIGGGQNNCISTGGGSASILGGNANCVSNNGSIVVGGYKNTNSGVYSFIAGGSANNVTANNAFVLGSNITATNPNTTYINNLSTIANAYINGTLSTNNGATFGGSGQFNGAFLTVNSPNAGSNSNLVLATSAKNYTLYTDSTAGTFNVYDGTLVRMVVSGSNIGIGTTTPNSKLTVAGTLSASDTATLGSLTVNSGATVTAGGLTVSSGTASLQGGATVSSGLTVSNGGLTVSNGGLTVSTGTASLPGTTTNGVTANAPSYFNGNVGILKNNPAYALDVTGTIQASQNVGLNGTLYINDQATTGYAYLYRNSGITYLKDSVYGGSVITYNTLGNIGIGTTPSTVALLDINGITRSGTGYLIGTNGGSGGHYLYDAGAGNVGIKAYGTAGSSYFTFSSSGVFSSLNNGGYFAGNVGIGTTTPNATLTVNGSLSASFGTTIGTLTAQNLVTNGNEVIFSDGVGTNDTGNGANTVSLNYTNGAYVGLSGSGQLYALGVPRYTYLTANTTAIGPGSAAFFTATPTDVLFGAGVYELEAMLFFIKTTAGTLSAIVGGTSSFLANTELHINITISATGSLLTTTIGESYVTQNSNGSNNAPLGVSSSLASGSNYGVKIKALIQNLTGATNNVGIYLLQSAGTLTPLNGSYRKITRVA